MAKPYIKKKWISVESKKLENAQRIEIICIKISKKLWHNIKLSKPLKIR